MARSQASLNHVGGMGSIHSSKEAMLGQTGEDPEITVSPEKRQHLASADQSSPLIPSLSGQMSPRELIFNPVGKSSPSLGLAFVIQLLQISAPPLTGVLLDAGIPILDSVGLSSLPLPNSWGHHYVPLDPDGLLYLLPHIGLTQSPSSQPGSWHSPCLKHFSFLLFI